MSTATQPMRALVASAALTLMTGVVAAHDSGDRHKERQSYQNDVLVSNGVVPAPTTDPNLVNAWGVVFNPTGAVWVSNEGSGKSTLYDGKGQPQPQPQPLIVTIPGPGGTVGHPTGIVFSGGADFIVTNGTTNGPARFIFATLAGTIAGWAPNVNLNNAFTAVDNSGLAAVYTGLALGGNGATHLLYAANARAGRIDVFDGAFKPAEVSGGFTDPKLPADFTPFGIQAIGGDIYVTYERQDGAHGPGLGFVNVFDPDGKLLRRVASRGVLNAPWGLALAPASFGKFGGALLVGNLGDGTINAFGPRSGTFLGKLRDADNRPLRIDGLWGIAFGNGVLSQKTNALHYTSGPNHGQDGVYGVISAVTN